MESSFHNPGYFSSHILFPFFLSIFLASASFLVVAQNVSASGSMPALTLTVNGSALSVAVPSGSRLEIRWSATGATACAGDWTATALKTAGVQFGRITKPRSFTVVCADGKGHTAKKSVTVRFTSELPQRLSAAELPGITVMSPNGNEIWTQEEGRTIVWTASDVPLLKNGVIIDLIDARGASYAIASSTLSGTARNFFWLIPSSLPAGRYKVRVSVLHSTENDTSDNFFSVAKAYAGPRKALVCGILGDANGDGAISSADAGRIAVFSANPRIMTDNDFKRADVDVNGVIAEADIVQVNQYLADTIRTFSGCLVPGVSVAISANGSSSSLVSVPISSTVTLSWTSAGAGRCLLEEAAVPVNGMALRSASVFSSTTYKIQCFGAGNSQSVSDEVTVVVEPPNKMPLITSVDAPTSFRVGVRSLWTVTAADPDGEAITLTVQWGDGKQDISVASSTLTGRSVLVPLSHVFTAERNYTVSVTAKDKRGGEVTRSFSIVVTEAPRASNAASRYQFAALFDGFRTLFPF